MVEHWSVAPDTRVQFPLAAPTKHKTMFISELITVTVITILATISPGPDFAMVTRNSLTYSRKIGIYTALGISFGLAVHVTYSLVGIGLIIAKSIVLFNIIKYIGAGYLIYIGYQSLKAKSHINNQSIVKTNNTISRIKALKIGFLTNALNPKATVFFLSLFTQVINPATPLSIQLFYGIEIMGIAFIWFAILSVIFTHTIVKTRIVKVQHYFERLMGVVLIALGIKVALSSSE